MAPTSPSRPYATTSSECSVRSKDAASGANFVLSIHRLVLDDLGVRQIAAVVGGSMGGMLALEWAYFGKEYIRSIVPIATSARHSAWGISWGEAQRQSIYSDPKYDDGYYSSDDPPAAGLGAARMAALLTYRSRDSFESRFGRNAPDPSRGQSINGKDSMLWNPSSEHWSIHNDGHKSTRGSIPSSRAVTPVQKSGNSSPPQSASQSAATNTDTIVDPQFNGTTQFRVPSSTPKSNRTTNHFFSAQSYLRYQGTKFVSRFDSNCYIAITRKLDTHDVSRNRTATVAEALSQIEQPALILGIQSDGLFTFAEQRELAEGIPHGRLGTIHSPEGHDAFLLQFEQVNRYLLDFFREVLPDLMSQPSQNGRQDTGSNDGHDGVGVLNKSSTFGEAEVEDLTAW